LRVPKLWSQTIEAHRRTVHDAILDTAWGLAVERGPLAVTMSQIAENAGIGRATLYKYFSDVETILFACHERHVSEHLDHLIDLRNRPGEPMSRLQSVLEAYALIAHHRGRHGTDELGALLHRGDRVARAEQQLVELFAELLSDVAGKGQLRDDVAPSESAAYCLNALAAASSLPTEEAVHRLVGVTVDGLRPHS
jgi:AcrR family transcriptional regulator